jgi:hypothetical protein
MEEGSTNPIKPPKKQPLTRSELYLRGYEKLKEDPERNEKAKARNRVHSAAYNEATRNDPKKMAELAARQRAYRARKKAEKEEALQSECV